MTASTISTLKIGICEKHEHLEADPGLQKEKKLGIQEENCLSHDGCGCLKARLPIGVLPRYLRWSAYHLQLPPMDEGKSGEDHKHLAENTEVREKGKKEKKWMRGSPEGNLVLHLSPSLLEPFCAPYHLTNKGALLLTNKFYNFTYAHTSTKIRSPKYKGKGNKKLIKHVLTLCISSTLSPLWREKTEWKMNTPQQHHLSIK